MDYCCEDFENFFMDFRYGWNDALGWYIQCTSTKGMTPIGVRILYCPWCGGELDGGDKSAGGSNE